MIERSIRTSSSSVCSDGRRTVPMLRVLQTRSGGHRDETNGTTKVTAQKHFLPLMGNGQALPVQAWKGLIIVWKGLIIVERVYYSDIVIVWKDHLVLTIS